MLIAVAVRSRRARPTSSSATVWMAKRNWGAYAGREVSAWRSPTRSATQVDEADEVEHRAAGRMAARPGLRRTAYGSCHVRPSPRRLAARSGPHVPAEVRLHVTRPLLPRLQHR